MLTDYVTAKNLRLYNGGAINVDGCGCQGASVTNMRGGGEGGGICIRCRTWETGENVQLKAKGGSSNSGANSGYGGGGGRIAVLRNADLDPTPVGERAYLSVDAGTSKTTSGCLPEAGTIHWQRTGGMMVILR